MRLEPIRFVCVRFSLKHKSRLDNLRRTDEVVFPVEENTAINMYSCNVHGVHGDDWRVTAVVV